MTMHRVIAYDVSDDNTRAKLAAVLGSIGERLQKSVFLCEANQDGIDAAVRRAGSLINHGTDALHLFPQCPECHRGIRTIGQAHVPKTIEYWII